MKQNNFYTILFICGVLILSGCTLDIDQEKRNLQNDYIKYIISSRCNEAQKTLDKMIQVDPGNEMPMRYFRKPTAEELRKLRQKNLSKEQYLKEYSDLQYANLEIIEYDELKNMLNSCIAGKPINKTILRQVTEFNTEENIESNYRKVYGND